MVLLQEKRLKLAKLSGSHRGAAIGGKGTCKPGEIAFGERARQDEQAQVKDGNQEDMQEEHQTTCLCWRGKPDQKI